MKMRSQGTRPGWGNLRLALQVLSVLASQGGHHDSHQSRVQSLGGVWGGTADLKEMWVRKFQRLFKTNPLLLEVT